MAQDLSVHITETLKLRSQLRLTYVPAGSRRWVVEQVVGDDLHRKTGVWNRKERLIDREHDWYREVVTDRDGNILRHCEEPLSQHRNAKRAARANV